MLDFFEESLAPLATAVTTFAGDRPDLVAHDLAASETARLLARSWGAPVVQLCPTIASSPTFSMSQRQSREAFEPPQEGIAPDDPLIAEFVARRDAALAAAGLTGVTIDGFGAERGPNIVFLPRAFQIAPETFDDRFTFIGPCFADTQPTGAWRPPGSGRQVVLLSLGSSYSPDQGAYLRRCVEALADSPWHVVVTLGHRVAREELGPLPGNVEAHQWLRHPEVLPYTAVFITHGGMGSLMESLWFGVPMVLVPYHVDQRVIASQAADLDLGRVLHRDATTPQALRAALDEVASNPGIAAAVARMRQHVHQAGGAARGADAIEALLRQHTTQPPEMTHA
jgi:MGT family glycosyltransferase